MDSTERATGRPDQPWSAIQCVNQVRTSEPIENEPRAPVNSDDLMIAGTGAPAAYAMPSTTASHSRLSAAYLRTQTQDAIAVERNTGHQVRPLEYWNRTGTMQRDWHLGRACGTLEQWMPRL